MKSTISFSIVFVTVLVSTFSVFPAGVPKTINYQGRLTDSSGAAIPDGSYDFTFAMYDDDGLQLWSSQQSTAIQVTNGLFSVSLGEAPMVPLPEDLFLINATLHLGITVGNDPEMVPRTKLTAVPYSFHSLSADTARSVAQQSLTNEMISDTTIRFEKLAHNDGQPGHVIAFAEGKDGPHWEPRPFEDLGSVYYPVGWADVGSVVRLSLSSDNVGIGTASPGNHKLYVSSNESGVSGATGFVKNDHPDGLGMIVENNSTDLTLLVSQIGTGDILRCDSYMGVGSWTPVFAVKNDGRTVCPTLELTGGSDLAEPFVLSSDETAEAGAVVVIDDTAPGKLTLSTRPYDTRVAGVISGAGGVRPGLTLSQEGTFDRGQNVAIGGRAYCLADASYGPIRPGDLLTTSATPGHAMMVGDRRRACGAILGKALSPLDEGRGLVLILVSLQ